MPSVSRDYVPVDGRWKGFELAQVGRFGVRQVRSGITVEYRTRSGSPYRTKLFADGDTRWLGPSKPQLPYGLETLELRGRSIFLTEGESCALALRLAYPNTAVLGIPGANSWKADWTSYAEPFERVYLSFDADEAGATLLKDVLTDIPAARPILLPHGADTRDVLQTLGKNAYRVLIEHANATWNFNDAFNRRQIVERVYSGLGPNV